MYDPENQRPSDEALGAVLAQWTQAKRELATYRASESSLRARLFAWLFPEADEGTNTTDIPYGWKAKGVQNINRKIDPGQLQAIAPKLVEMGVNLSLLVEWKPELKTSAYRELTQEQRLLFDSCLTIKEGSQELSLVEPKKE